MSRLSAERVGQLRVEERASVSFSLSATRALVPFVAAGFCSARTEPRAFLLGNDKKKETCVSRRSRNAIARFVTHARLTVSAGQERRENSDSVTSCRWNKGKGRRGSEGSPPCRDGRAGGEGRGDVFSYPRGPGRVVEFCAANSILCSAESGALLKAEGTGSPPPGPGQKTRPTAAVAIGIIDRSRGRRKGREGREERGRRTRRREVISPALPSFADRARSVRARSPAAVPRAIESLSLSLSWVIARG